MFHDERDNKQPINIYNVSVCSVLVAAFPGHSSCPSGSTGECISELDWLVQALENL